MGSWLSKSAHSDVACPEESFQSPDTMPVGPAQELVRTKERLLAKFGPPTSIGGPSDEFLTTCYQEDHLLKEGLRNQFTERLVWNTENDQVNEQVVAYLNGDQVLKIFINSYM